MPCAETPTSRKFCRSEVSFTLGTSQEHTGLNARPRGDMFVCVGHDDRTLGETGDHGAKRCRPGSTAEQEQAAIGLHAGWVFWLKVFKTVTAPGTNANAASAFWGTEKLLDGWLACLVMAAVVAVVARLPQTPPPEKTS